MNFLGHALLSGNDPAVTAGNMAGDFFKGPIYKIAAPERILKGAVLHRFIDTQTDAHPSVKDTTALFRNETGKYAPAVTDVLWDYFIANDKDLFSNQQQLEIFAHDIYKRTGSHIKALPAPFQQLFPYMQQNDWLSHYRSIEGIQRALTHLNQRALYQHINPAIVWAVLMLHFDEIGANYKAIRTDLMAGSKTFTRDISLL